MELRSNGRKWRGGTLLPTAPTLVSPRQPVPLTWVPAEALEVQSSLGAIVSLAHAQLGQHEREEER